MHKRPGLQMFLCLLTAYVMSLSPVAPYLKGAPQRQAGQAQPAKSKNSPCDILPNPPGVANGVHKQCPPKGSSSGIAKADFNGDGFADLAIGVPEQDLGSISNTGAVHVVYGSVNGLNSGTAGVPAAQFFSEATAGMPAGATHPDAGDLFGFALAAGDFNHDGYSDLAIGIPNKTINLPNCLLGFCLDDIIPQAGAIVVIYGSPIGLTLSRTGTPAPQYFDLGASSAAINLAGGKDSLESAMLGYSLAWGDFNGDGTGDLAIGAMGLFYEVRFDPVSFMPQDDQGVVWEIFGATAGTGLSLGGNRVFSMRDINVDQSTISAGFGVVLAAGDFDGDGRSDLAIGMPDADFQCQFLQSNCTSLSASGAVAVLYSNQSGLGAHSQLWRQGFDGVCCNASNNGHFGAALAAGDFNGDGKSELAVGMPGVSVGGVAGAGAVNIFDGSTVGLVYTGEIWNQDGISGQASQPGDAFGFSLAAGDFNADGKTDLAVGAPYKNVNGVSDAGIVDIIYGSAAGLSSSVRSTQTWHRGTANLLGPSLSGQHFGWSLSAWNFGHDETTVIPTIPPVITTYRTADLAIGVPGDVVGGVSGAGAVNVIYGSHAANGLNSSNNQLFTQNSPGIHCCAQGNAHFGLTLY